MQYYNYRKAVIAKSVVPQELEGLSPMNKTVAHVRNGHGLESLVTPWRRLLPQKTKWLNLIISDVKKSAPEF
jgi:hypothetical protein